MNKVCTLLITLFGILLAVLYHYWLLCAPTTHTMSVAEWKFEAQYGYFSHDHDPESWQFRATTLPSLGLLERKYEIDGDSGAEEGLISGNVTRTQWNRFQRFIQHLNMQDPANKRYKLLYIIRHGQGVHNVKEEEVGRDDWNVSCSTAVGLHELWS
jgi:hypothetical protein